MSAKKQVTSIALVTLSVLLLRIYSETTANLSYVVIAAYALFGRKNAILALTMSWLVTMINPGLAPETSLGAIGRYLVIFAAALSVLIRSRFVSSWQMNPLTASTLGLGAFIILHSMIFSPMFDVSILKALSWAIAIITIFGAWTGLSDTERNLTNKILFIGLIGILALSLPLLILPQGYFRNGSGFQGILNHPQAFGPTMALLGAWAAGQSLGERRPTWLALGITALCLVMIVLSEARTAGFAMVLSVAAAAVMATLISGKQVTTVLPGLKSRRFLVVAFCVVTGAIAIVPMLMSVAADFITKSGRIQAGGLLQVYELSRGAVIDAMTVNIRQTPWQGIGFGIASDPLLMSVVRDPILDLPVAASIEKGVMPLAVLEELGIVGFVLVAGWLWVLFRLCARGYVGSLAVYFTILLSNFGESVFFSPGGLGMLQLVLLGWAVSMGLKKNAVRSAAS